MIDEMSISSSSSFLSLSSGSLSSDFDDDKSDDEMLVNEFFVSRRILIAVNCRFFRCIRRVDISLRAIFVLWFSRHITGIAIVIMAGETR